MVGPIVAAHAATGSTFLQFQDGSVGSFLTNAFDGSGNWTGATLGTSGSSYPILATFQPTTAMNYIPYTPAGVPLEGVPLTGNLSYTATTMPNIAGGTGNGYAQSTVSTYNQAYASVTLTMTGTGAYAGLGTLFSMTATAVTPSIPAGNLSGQQGGNSATLSGSDVLPAQPNVVTFSSPYIDFSSANTKNYGLSYSGVSPSFVIAGAFPMQYLANFSAETTGTFAAIFPQLPPVPEPGTLSMLFGLGVSGSVLLRRRRR